MIEEIFSVGEIYVGVMEHSEVFVEVVRVTPMLVWVKVLETERKVQDSRTAPTGNQGERIPIPGAYVDERVYRMRPTGLEHGTLELSGRPGGIEGRYYWWGDERGRRGRSG
ncbi:MAG TPA: hypothetical protein VN035_14920 [Microbacterium sp.]|nr:hypothetical protein [Microbacterium sp.]